MNYYRQCVLNKPFKLKDGSVGVETITSWIPEQFAVKGNYIKVLDKQSFQWQDGWIVIEVGLRAPEEEVLERNQDYKHQRKASDI